MLKDVKNPCVKPTGSPQKNMNILDFSNLKIPKFQEILDVSREISRSSPASPAPGKTKNHAAGSLELIVENLVKTWEMEIAFGVKFCGCF